MGIRRLQFEGDSTPVSKFDLVCDKSKLVSVAFSANMAGNAVGTLILSITSDRFGRKPVFYLALLLHLIFGNALLLVPSYTSFVIVKFLGAIAFRALYQLPYIIVLELCNLRLRTYATYTSWLMISISHGALALTGWIFNEWKTYLLVTQLPLAIFILFWRFIPESPRWLLSQGKLAECEEVMTKIAVKNGKKFTEEKRQLLEIAYEEEKKKVPASNILTTAPLTKYLALTAITFCFGMICTVSLNTNVHNIKGNFLINYLFLCSFEIPGDLFSTVNALLIGRRWNTVLCIFLASIFAIVASFLATTDGWSLIAICGVTKMFLRASGYSCTFQIGELFPTPLRATAYGIVLTSCITSTILAPSLVGNGESRLPYYIICAFCILGALVASFLPETMGNPLPQSIREAKQIGKGESYFSFHRKGSTYKKAKTNSCLEEDSEELDCKSENNA